MNAAACAFTLVELLVVIAVLAVLVSLLLPALAGARGSGRAGVCASNLRQIQIASDAYANDHADRYAPGSPDALANLVRWHGARGSVTQAFSAEGGTLSDYLGSGDGAAGSSAIRACPEFAATAARLAAAGIGFERSAGGYGYNNAFCGDERRAAGIEPASGREVWAMATDLGGSARAKFERPSGTVGFADAALADGNAAAGVIEYSFVEPRFWPDLPGQRADPSVHFRHGSTARQKAAAGGSQALANFAWLDGHVSPERMGKTWSSGVYPASAGDYGIGWPGTADDNSMFEYR